MLSWRGGRIIVKLLVEALRPPWLSLNLMVNPEIASARLRFYQKLNCVYHRLAMTVVFSWRGGRIIVKLLVEALRPPWLSLNLMVNPEIALTRLRFYQQLNCVYHCLAMTVTLRPRGYLSI